MKHITKKERKKGRILSRVGVVGALARVIQTVLGSRGTMEIEHDNQTSVLSPLQREKLEQSIYQSYLDVLSDRVGRVIDVLGRNSVDVVLHTGVFGPIPPADWETHRVQAVRLHLLEVSRRVPLVPVVRN